MSDVIIRDAKIFEATSFPERGMVITESDLDQMVSEFRAGACKPVQIRVEHMLTAFEGKLGRVVDMWRSGKDLLAKIEWPSIVWQCLHELGMTSLSVGLDKEAWRQGRKRVDEVSVVDVPRVLTARAFSDSIADSEGLAYCFNFPFAEEGGQSVMSGFSPEVEAAIKAAEDRGREFGVAAGIEQGKQQFSGTVSQLAELQRKAAKDDAAVKLASLTARGVLPPACVRFAEAILVDGDAQVNFSDGGATTVREAFLNFMANMPVVVDMTGGKESENDEDVEFSDADAKAAEAFGQSKEEYLAGQKGEF